MTNTQLKDLMDQSRRFAHMMGRVCHLYHKQAESPLLHPGQGRLLSLIRENEPVGQKELVELLDIRPSSLSELLKKLEEKGLVSRAQDEADKRNVVVSLTEEGRSLAEQAEQGRDALEAKVFDALSEDELHQLHAIFAKLMDSWQTTLAEAGEPEEPLTHGPHHRPHCGPRPGFDSRPGCDPRRGPEAERCPRHHGPWEDGFRGWR